MRRSEDMCEVTNFVDRRHAAFRIPAMTVHLPTSCLKLSVQGNRRAFAKPDRMLDTT